MLIGTKSKHAVVAMTNLALASQSKTRCQKCAGSGRAWAHNDRTGRSHHSACKACQGIGHISMFTPISLATLAECPDVTASVSYLEQIFADLRKAELVISTRGPGGGYVVSNLDITVAQIVNAIHEQPAEESTRWKAVERRVGESLNNITLRDLLV